MESTIGRDRPARPELLSVDDALVRGGDGGGCGGCGCEGARLLLPWPLLDEADDLETS